MSWSKTFDVCLKTQIGKRRGKMAVKIDGHSVSGKLYLLNQTEKIYGEIDDSGNCHICGKLVSLMRIVPFDGWGTITADEICLSLVGSNSRYILNGKPAVNTAN